MTEQSADDATNWGRWGPEDERGALNLLTPDVVKRAAASVTTGRIYPLGIPIQPEGVPLIDFRGKPMRLTLQDPTDEGMLEPFGCEAGTGSNEDVMVLPSHVTSHMDALIHVYQDHHHYNGVPSSAMKAMAGATKLGIEKVAGLAARAVLLDLPAHLGGDERWLSLGQGVSAADLETTCEAQGVEVLAGDVVLVRTGYLQQWFEHRGRLSYEQPGLTLEAARWLARHDVVAVGADNAAVEVIPFDHNDFMGVHKVLLVRHGIYMLEYLDLSAPARDRCYEGLLTVAPLKVTGATGSPVNPILIG